MRLPILLSVAVCTSSFAQPASRPTTTASSAEVFCRLSPEQLAARRHELIPGLFKRARRVVDVPNGVRFTFEDKPGLVADLARIMEQEQDCCSFLRFQLTTEPNAGPITLDVTGPAGTGEMLRKL